VSRYRILIVAAVVVIAAAGSEAFYIEIDSAARQLRRLAPTTSLRDL